MYLPILNELQTFSYDDLDRLKTASESAGYNYTYEYNSIGNLTKFTNAGVESNYTYHSGGSKLHSLTASGSAVFTYDANGNMTSDALKCYEYNEANQLKKVKRCADNQTIVEYVYDFNGKRIIKKNYSNGNLSNIITSWTPSFETKAIVGGSTEAIVYYLANGELVDKRIFDRCRS